MAGIVTTTRQIDKSSGNDIIVSIGQSNQYEGTTGIGATVPDVAGYDATDSDIKQWGRVSPNDGVIIEASDMLHHNRATLQTASVGHALAFAKLYKNLGHLKSGRKILIVPAAKGGTGFADNEWNEDDPQYNDAVTRTLAAIDATEGGYNRVVAVVWSQIEEDAKLGNTANYGTQLPAFIDAFRADTGTERVPFVLTGSVPAWRTVSDTYGSPATKATLHAVVTGIPASKDYTAYADPVGLVGNGVHFTAESMRGTTPDYADPATCGLAGKVYLAWLEAKKNN